MVIRCEQADPGLVSRLTRAAFQGTDCRQSVRVYVTLATIYSQAASLSQTQETDIPGLAK